MNMRTKAMRSFGLAVISGAILGARMSAMAANNPLDIIRADSHSAKSPGIRVEACAEGGSNLCSIVSGDYLKYEAYDFDSGVAAFKARIAAARPGAIEVRLDRVDGPLMGKCRFGNTGGWQQWQDVVCNLDNSQSGVRDIFLVFRGDNTTSALVNLSRFVFLKSVVVPGQVLDLSSRLDVADDEPQATKAWGMPESGFTDDFEAGLGNWVARGMDVSPVAVEGRKSVMHRGKELGMAYTPNVYVNKTDVGGEWRTLAEASLAADIVLDAKEAVAGIGFASKDGSQWISVLLNPAANTIEARRKLLDGTDVIIHRHPKQKRDPATGWTLKPGVKYRLQLAWSPYANALIAFLHDANGAVITSFRTAIDLPAARRPMLLGSGGDARFDNVTFDPTLDGWNFKWEWYKTPVLSKDVCNPAVWRGKDGKFYMMWRKFGADSYHGVASSSDAIHWTRVNDNAINCGGDMNIVMDPFGDGLDYITGGGRGAAWWVSNGTNQYSEWKASGRRVGDIFGTCRIQEILDTRRSSQIQPIKFGGQEYRFIGYSEDWNRSPKPHTVVLLSNNLTDWVLAGPKPLIPPSDHFWGEKGNAIGSAMVLPDGNILIASCSCTYDGYTGASEPSNVSAIADGKEPWKILKLAILPDAPVSREKVWYQGPNFGTAFCYDKDSDTLYFYGGFHDYEVGMMRVRNFSRYFAKKP